MVRSRLGVFTSGSLLVVLVAALALSAPSYAAEAVADYTTLPLTDLYDVAVDDTNGLVYVAGGQNADHILVVTPDGTSVGTIAVAGATNLALSGDGTTLAASIPSSHAIAVVDLSDDSVATYPLGDQACPSALAIIGTKVWYYQPITCSGDNTDIFELDETTGATFSPFDYPAGTTYDPDLIAVPGTHDLLVNGCCSGAFLDLIDTDTTQVLASKQEGSRGAPVMFGPDPDTVWLGLQEYHLPDLARLDHTTLPGDFGGVVAIDNQLVVTKTSDGPVNVYDRDTSALLNQIEFGATPYHSQPQRVALAQGTVIAFGFIGGDLVMYHDSSPGTAAPTLTAHVPDTVLVGHQTTIAGTLSLGAGVVAGSTITVRDDSTGGTIATTTTDADGSWSVPYTFDTAEGVYLTVLSSATQGEKAAITRLSLIVEKFEADFGFQAPATVQPGQVVDVTGTLTADGKTLAGKGLTWDVSCLDPGFAHQLSAGSTTTADDGTYAISYDPGRCTEARLGVDYGGDDLVYDSYDTVDTAVSWHLTKVTVTTPPSAYVGDGASGTVTVTVDGQPAAGVAVDTEVSVPGVGLEDVSGTTGADGTLPVSFDTPVHGTYRVSANVEDSADTLGDYAESLLDVDQVASDLSVQIDKGEITIGGSLTFTGTLTHADGAPTAGSSIDIQVTDPGSTTTKYYVTGTVAADGTFEITDTPPTPGNYAYRVRYNGDPPRYQAWQSEYTAVVIVDKVAPHLSIDADRTGYVAGDRARLHVDLTDSATRQVTVTATRPGRQPTVVFTGTVPGDGLDLTPTVTRSEAFTVTTAGDDTHQPGQASLAVPVRLALTTHPASPFVWRGTTAVFTQHGTATFRCVEAKPRRRAVVVVFVAQRRESSGWRTVAKSRALPFSDGRTEWRLPSPHRPDVVYRVRAVFAGDSGNSESFSNWLHFRFGSSS